jgi:hypothetical protein
MNDNHRTPDPDDLADLDPVVVGQLRRTLQAVAASTPTEDRSAALLAAIDTRPAATDAEPPAEEPAMELDRPSTTRPPIWRRPAVLATAAAVAVVALIAGVGLATQDDDQVETDPAEDRGLPAPTGWYLPPDGWDITAVRTDFDDVGESGSCPCRTLIAVDEGAQPVSLIVRESAGPMESRDGAAIDVGGRPGELVDVGTDLLAVGARDHHLVIVFSGVDPEAVLALADAWLDRVEVGEDVDPADLPLPGGMSAGAIVESPAMRSAHMVDVTAVERSTGRTVYYQLALAGTVHASFVIDAQDVRQQGSRFEVLTSIGATPLVALVGGDVDLAAGPSAFAEEGDLSVDELSAFLAGLHEVSLAEWHAATADAEVADVVRAAESLFGPPLVDG